MSKLAEPDEEMSKLKQQIEEAVASNDELRIFRTKVRTAFAVADALQEIIDAQGATVDAAAKAGGISAEQLTSVLEGNVDVEISVGVIAAISSGLGYRFYFEMSPKTDVEREMQVSKAQKRPDIVRDSTESE
jgi:regulator of replication initiation timing